MQVLATARFCKSLQTLVTTGLPTLSQVWQPLARSEKQTPFSRYPSNDILITLIAHCDTSVNKERRDEGPERRNEGTNDRNEGTNDRNGERETLWHRPNSVSGTGNEDPPCVDMGGGRVTLYLDV